MTHDDRALGVGIIGCGRIVGHHVAAIEASPDLELRAVADLNEERAHAMAPRAEVHVYRNYRIMLDENPDIDVVAIATPSGLHYPQAREVIEQWGRSVVIEKPPTLRFTELDALVELASSKGSHVFPVFQYRFNAPVQRIRRGIAEGDLGAPHLFSIRQRWCRPQRYYDQSVWRGTYSLDGGALTNQGIHHLDLVTYLAGPVASVSAVKATFGAAIEASTRPSPSSGRTASPAWVAGSPTSFWRTHRAQTTLRYSARTMPMRTALATTTSTRVSCA